MVFGIRLMIVSDGARCGLEIEVMDAQIPQTITAYVAIAVPVTVAIANFSKIVLEWLNQRHAVKKEVVQQTHEITTQYLNRALDPTVPLVIRHQLLRFLATPDRQGTRLSDWAKSELQRVGVVVEEANRAVEEAEKELLTAKTAGEIAAAERKLSLATSKKQMLLEAPKAPPLTPAALRAGVVKEKQLSGLVMKGADLSRMALLYRNLRESDFSGSQICGGNFQGSDLRGANFEKADLTGVSFYEADLRGAKLNGAKLLKAGFQEARLEGADLSEAALEEVDLRATYDTSTKWPVGFKPDEHGAVKV
jgi:hypothetical protein